ncbi:molecular chaperone DnaJ [Acidobacteria bacterium AH-259-O06]|nr:molecular chaperone DnaJ [Acidobacteria bacterium AH-259-O06]
MQNNYYDILGLNRNASQSEIKKTYRRLARKSHPDVNPGDKSAEERFKQIQEAYKVLNDAEKRKVYDRYGYYREGQQGPGAEGFRDFGGFSGFDFENVAGGGWQGTFRDIFSDLFGGKGPRARSSRPGRGPDLEYHVTIPFLDALRGTQTPISITRRDICTRCKGSGSTSSGVRKRTCPTCRGSGQTQHTRGMMRFSVTCRRCQGSGSVRAGDCSNCGGNGLIRKVESLRVRIPPGVNTGSRVRVPGKGDAGEFGGPRGDLFLVVQVQQHPFFEREGNNIVCSVPLTITEAALGAEIEVPTVEGKARLKIPGGTQSGQKFRLRGRGVPSAKGGGRGDQLVEVKVVLPPVRDARSREILREFAQLNPENPRAKLEPN